MNRDDKREKLRIRRRKQVARQKKVLLITMASVILTVSVICGTILSLAKNPQTDVIQHKYYKSITIQQGDSLWSIAREYARDDAHDYIKEIKQLNGLHSETIHAGQHLIITYYDAENNENQ